VDAAAVPPDLLLELTGRYLEPHRHYHGIEHIAAMLQSGRTFPLDAVQTMAVWFHDAVYDTRSKTNEEDSADLARTRLLAGGWSATDCDRVHRIVLDTKRHRPSSPESAPVLDLDLMSLALPWPAFAANTTAIRREYAHVADADFAAGRATFFAAMLQRERLFFTPWGAQFEAAARGNLRRAAGG
jgi:predicted metal-dependent HD superfamily phosphohydrolase